MSIFGVEQVLYDVSIKRDARERFRADSAAFLLGYPLTPEERTLIENFQVAELYRRGANPMLTLGFWTQARSGDRSMTTYVRSMRDGAGPAAAERGATPWE